MIQLGLLIALAAGCSRGPEFGKIQGKLVLPGFSADGVRIEFHPDATAGNSGPMSVGETDGEGNFTLSSVTSDDKVIDGAVVGKHRVVLQDLRLAQSETGRGVPQRFSRDFAAVLTTPLTADVQPGEQSLTLQPGAK